MVTSATKSQKEKSFPSKRNALVPKSASRHCFILFTHCTYTSMPIMSEEKKPQKKLKYLVMGEGG